MLRITLFISLFMMSFAQAQNAKVFGLGGYLQGGNAYEMGGIIVKYAFSPEWGLDGIMSFDAGSYSINGRMMYHIYDVFKVPKGELPIVVGGGAGFAGWAGGSAVKVLGSVGLNYVFPNAPVDILMRLDPTLQLNFNNDDNHFGVTFKVGARYFFF